ncbi:iron-sulfur cluster co-chaperone protein HscB homolog isoform X2 [Cryptomeria japonica]|uniref:iron-sulfur cluster co-chaperone protein HscB homolog isoform X2 n=1 Tax=Cryptomeria japonica TaxID=3369 RepID=UPI0025ACBACB|nr:iron-sulfur cluster co-chaperone protein HscB homolog isoform X2 [Cryptomeria japonica]
MVRRRLLSIASATCVHGTQGSPSSSQHSFSASTKFPIALQLQPHLSQYMSPHKLSKENYISSHQTAPYFHLVSRGNFSTLATAVNSAIKCWACGAEASDSPFLACSSCKSVQPLDSSVDFFHIFNLEPGYDVDAKDLEKKYKDWQKRLHPDLFQCKSEQEKEYSTQQSAQVIKAYNTLLKPLSRAEYMVLMQGWKARKDECSRRNEEFCYDRDFSTSSRGKINTLKGMKRQMQRT